MYPLSSFTSFSAGLVVLLQAATSSASPVAAAAAAAAGSLWPHVLPPASSGDNSLSRYLPPVVLQDDINRCALTTPRGDINGVMIDGGCRYTVKYGVAERWATAVAVDCFSDYPSTSLPPSCPQTPDTYIGASVQSEDCLYAVIYTPPTASQLSRTKLPVYVWIHGGSFVAGSASAPGLVGSKLAVEGGMIVVTLQYRLGVLGFLPPTSVPAGSDPNLGLKDVVLALEGVRNHIAVFGGDPSRVTAGGQSSGAGMIRALWSAPAARGLFRAAILQSDPMAYGLASPSVTSALTQAFYKHPTLSSCTTLDCLKQISFSQIVDAQSTILQSAPVLIPGVAFAEPIRPTYYTPSIDLDPVYALANAPRRLAFVPPDLPLLITTTANEAGSVTQSLFPSPVAPSNETYLYALSALVGPERASKIVNSTLYALSTPNTATTAGEEDGFRQTFERLVTDGIWRCANRDVARKWSARGGKVWVGEWTRGSGYASNLQGYCAEAGKGRVCHEDDILPTFGTTPGPSTEDLALHAEVSSAWIAFIHNLDPNQLVSPVVAAQRENVSMMRRLTRSYPVPIAVRDTVSRWKPFKSDSFDTDVHSIGGGPTRSCSRAFCGTQVLFDWQVYATSLYL